MNFLKQYIVVFIVFILIDLVWLVKISTKFYQKNIGHLMSGKVNFIAAGLFYLLFVGAIVFFVVKPAVLNHSVLEAVLRGAFFGLIAYGTYDLTNQATLKEWPVIVTVVDLMWGTFVVAATSGISTFLSMKFFH